MRWVKLILRILGWLLTPLVALAASFVGATSGALAGRLIDSSSTAMYVTVGAGFVTSLAALLLWMRLLRRSPRLRHSLHVTREGIPETTDLAGEAEPPAAASEPQNPEES